MACVNEKKRRLLQWTVVEAWVIFSRPQPLRFSQESGQTLVRASEKDRIFFGALPCRRLENNANDICLKLTDGIFLCSLGARHSSARLYPMSHKVQFGDSQVAL